MRSKLLLVSLVLLWVSAYSPALADCASPPSATPSQTYDQVLLATASAHLLAYWKLDETTGIVATDSSGNSRNGAYNGPTLNGTTFNDGSPAAIFDGVNDYVNLYSSSLATAYNFNEGTISLWLKPDSSFISSTSTGTFIALTNAAATSGSTIFHASPANRYYLRRLSGSTVSITYDNSSAVWLHEAITWSNAGNNSTIAYFNGTNVGSGTAASVTATLDSTHATLGSTGGSAQFAVTAIRDVAVWDTALTSGQIAALANLPTATPTPQPTCTPSTTPTPTNTATPTNTPTLTPNFYVYWLLPTLETTGTPQPAQAVRFGYTFTGGQVAISIFLAVLVFSILGIVTIWLLSRQREN